MKTTAQVAERFGTDRTDMSHLRNVFPLHLSVDDQQLASLISKMELVAYALVREGESYAASSLFHAVVAVEKRRAAGPQTS